MTMYGLLWLMHTHTHTLSHLLVSMMTRDNTTNLVSKDGGI